MFEWDDRKNAANIEKHGIASGDILPIFGLADAEMLVVEDRRRDYGDRHFVLLGPFKDTRKEVQEYVRRTHH